MNNSDKNIVTLQGMRQTSLSTYHDLFNQKLHLPEDKKKSSRIRNILDTISDIITVIDYDKNIIDINYNGCEFIGNNYDEIIGKKCYNVFQLKECNSVECTCNKTTISRQTEYGYYKFGEKEFKVASWPTVLDDNAVITLVMKDITDIQNSILSSYENQNKFQVLFENSIEGICLIKSNRIREANNAIANICGYRDKTEIIGVDIRTLIHPHDIKEVNSIYMLLHKGVISREYLEFRIIDRNKALKYLEITLNNVTIIDNEFLLCTCRDVTGKKSAEAAMLDSRNRAITSERETVHLNEKLKKLNEQLEEKVYERTLELQEALSELEVINDSLLEMNRRSQEDAQQYKAQSEQLMISEKKLQESNADKNKLFSIIAHDLKNPLQSLLTSNELMNLHVDNGNKEGLKKHLMRMEGSINRITNLLESLLIWSRTQTGRIDFNPEEYDIREILDEVKESFEVIASKKNIDLIISEVDSSLLSIDKNMISSVMRNILQNAFKFTMPGGKVNVDYKINNGDCIISIKDSGIGMSDELLENLFKAGTTVSRPGTNDEQGTGLGLAICKEFVDYHHGKIKVESKEGEGTTFKVKLPRKISKNGI